MYAEYVISSVGGLDNRYRTDLSEVWTIKKGRVFANKTEMYDAIEAANMRAVGDKCTWPGMRERCRSPHPEDALYHHFRSFDSRPDMDRIRSLLEADGVRSVRD